MSRRLAGLLATLLGVAAGACCLAALAGVRAPEDIKPIGYFYIENTLFGSMSVPSPEAVTAIVWDYRGLDTIYETSVFFLAVVAGVAVFRTSRELPIKRGQGLTWIGRVSTKLVAAAIAAVSASIALHGHLTPGGGFQGGSTLAVAPLLLIPIFSYYELVRAGVTSDKLIAARGAALAAIGLVAALPAVRGLEVVTNARFYPAYLFGQLMSGSLFLYNLFEYIAVASGFSAVFLYMSVEEEFYREEAGEGVGE